MVGIICKLRLGKFKNLFPGDTGNGKLVRHLASGLTGRAPFSFCLSTSSATLVSALGLVCVAAAMVTFLVRVHNT